MKARDIISYAIGVVGILFSAFGGFLTGIASFLLLVIFLAIKALLQLQLAKNKRFKI